MRASGGMVQAQRWARSALAGCALGMCALAAIVPSDARADQLSVLSERIMANPADVSLSIEYGKLAEANGKLRWALAAYERVLMIDPTNAEAMEGLSRVRWHMEPATTVWTLDGGVFVDTNPYRVGNYDPYGYSPNPYLNIFSAYPEKTDTSFVLGLSMRDDRPAGDLRWRTTARVEQQWWVDNTQLDGGYATAASGPMFQLTPTIAMRIAPMATYSWLNNGLDSVVLPNPYYDPVYYPVENFYYGPGGNDHLRFWEVGGLLGFEGYLNGAMQRLDVSVGYRTYGDAYSASKGLVVGVIGRFTQPNLFADDDALTVQPWFRWADLGEPQDDQYLYWYGQRDGSITEGGVKVGYSKALTSWMTLVGTMNVVYRDSKFSWENDPYGYFPPNELKEWVYTPGIAAVLPNVFVDGLDLRFEYSYEYTDSNIHDGDTAAQIFGTSFAYRF